MVGRFIVIIMMNENHSLFQILYQVISYNYTIIQSTLQASSLYNVILKQTNKIFMFHHSAGNVGTEKAAVGLVGCKAYMMRHPRATIRYGYRRNSR